MWLTRLCIHNPVFAALMMFALMVLGVLSWRQLSVEEFPDIEFPYVMITTDYAGASPKVVEMDVTRPLEEAINTIAGVRRVISTSYEGRSRIAVEFALGVPVTGAVQDVRDKVAAVRRQWRNDIHEPLVERYRPEQAPVMSLAVQAPQWTTRALTAVVEQQIVRRLQGVAGVGKLDVVGGVRRQIAIELQPERMSALGVGVDQVLQALRNDSQTVPVGSVVQGIQEHVISVQAAMQRPEDFERLVVAIHGQSPIYLQQVAVVHDSEQEPVSLALVNGQRAVSIDIVKLSGANTIAVVDAVREATENLRHDLPDGVTVWEVADSARSIRASLADVQKTLWEGAFLTIFIVFVFLGSWRSTLITGLTLPISLLGAIWALHLCGLTLNTMTLMALSLAIGLLIDDAIVVRENIVRHAAMGKSAYAAALDGTREIGLAVLATTLTIVAVFLPVAFMDGIIGRFFYQFGVAVAAAVLLSMFVSFTLDPMLSSRWADPHAHGVQGHGWLARQLNIFAQGLEHLADRYVAVLQRALRRRRFTLVVALSSLVGAWLLVGMVGKEFVPEPDLGEINIKMATPVGSSLAYSQQKAQQIEALIRRHPAVVTTYTTINSGNDVGKNRLSLRVRLVPKQEREVSQKQLVELWREQLSHLTGVELTSVAAAKESVGGGLKPIQISLQGNDLQQLQRLANQFQAHLQRIDGLVDLESSLKEARPSIAIQIDRDRAADLGVSVGQIGSALRPFLAGEAATTWQAPDGENYDVRVQLPADARQNSADVWRVPFASRHVDANGQAVMVQLGEVATLTPAQEAAQINRRNLYREVLFSANVRGRPAGDIGVDIEKAAAQITLPAGYRIVTQGQNKDMAESVGYAKVALVLAVLFIYVILGSQFNSFIHPLTIMASLPLSLVGVFAALWLCHSTLNIFSLIGIITLMGLVTKNAILLLDFILAARDKGFPREAAILAAGRTRLRPILMTTAAMVVGMLPLALGLGEGAEQRAPMAHALIGGVLTSTLLTLVVVPVLYSLLDDAVLRLRQRQTASVSLSHQVGRGS